MAIIFLPSLLSLWGGDAGYSSLWGEVHVQHIGSDDSVGEIEVTPFENLSERQQRVFERALDSASSKTRVESSVRFDTSHVSYEGEVYEVKVLILD
ncbi:hypothetical protein HARCEL1_00980 [Halococcoides cellulosivorans]|uniref:DUF7979 domain-containing protein n=1 Tax=Halococcoides cellulosivorans TaxID=1679096 RepID=A0A2R4WXX4_9EURY|nr:hypothetical protein HARCEL1_00980 [Halococcoides cellulosivorans]